MSFNLKGTLYMVEGEEVILRGLTYREFTSILEMDIESNFMFIYEVGMIGLVDIPNFYINEKRVTYNKEEHYGEVFNYNFDFIGGCVDIILKSTVMSNEEYEIIEDQCYFSDHIYTFPKSEELWDCRNCVKKKSIARRICTRFDDEEIEKILNSKNYLPEVLMTDEEKIESEGVVASYWEEHNEEEPNEKKEIVVKKKKQRKGFKDKINKEREKKEEREREIAEENEEEYSGSRKPVKVTMKTDMHTWVKCPGYVADKGVSLRMQIAFRCIANEQMLDDGGVMEQSNLFIEYTSAIKSYQNKIEEKRMDKRKKEMDKSK